MEEVLKKLLATLVVVSIFPASLWAQIDPVSMISRLLPAQIVTQEEMFKIVNVLFGNCVNNSLVTGEDIVAAFKQNGFLPNDFVYDPNAGVTKGLLSRIFYKAFRLRPTFEEWLYIAVRGLKDPIVTRIAQRHCLMATGMADELLTGREFIACMIALLNHELNVKKIPCGRFVYHARDLRTWLQQILKTVMSESEAATYIPCLIIVPTS